MNFTQIFYEIIKRKITIFIREDFLIWSELNVREEKMSKKLFVGNLDFKATEKELNKLFSEFGEIEDVAIIKDRDTNRSKGFGFVTFVNDEDADKAISGMNEKDFDGRKITVNVAKEREDNHHGHDRPRFERREESHDEFAPYFSTKVLK
jgi:RNA recognition motif-containing protein